MRRRGSSTSMEPTSKEDGSSGGGDDQDKDRRGHVVEAIETVQVIAALLAGTGIAFLDDLRTGENSTQIEQKVIRYVVICFVGLNMYGLIVLSKQLFYLLLACSEPFGEC